MDARTVLSVDKIDEIVQKHGRIVYYSFSEEMGNIPNHRIHSALNKSREIMDEIVKTDKISRDNYRESEELMELILEDLISSETDTIRLMKDLNSHDDYTYNHSVNVLLLSSLFSLKMDRFAKDDLKSILLGAFLHDIGKMKLEKSLLQKKARLNLAEFKKMKLHPQLGYEIIKNVASYNKIVQQIILFHHEKYNNNGYYSLPYENLPVFPKIVAICDVFDALTSRRPYRNATSPANAMKIILNSVNKHFEYELINEFVNILGPYLNNAKYFYGMHEICELSSQELGLIVGYGKDILKPEVIVFCKYQKARNKINVKFYDKPFRSDLQKDKTRFMTNILSNEYQAQLIRNRLLEKLLLFL